MDSAPDNENLPNYVLLNNDWIPNGGFENFGSSFLPANNAAMMLRAKGTPVDNIVPSDTLNIQKAKLALLAQQDVQFGETTSQNDAINAAVRNYEKAFLMQSSIRGIADLSDEPEYIHRLYGTDSKNDFQKYYAMQCSCALAGS